MRRSIRPLLRVFCGSGRHFDLQSVRLGTVVEADAASCAPFAGVLRRPKGFAVQAITQAQDLARAGYDTTTASLAFFRVNQRPRLGLSSRLNVLLRHDVIIHSACIGRMNNSMTRSCWSASCRLPSPGRWFLWTRSFWMSKPPGGMMYGLLPYLRVKSRQPPDLRARPTQPSWLPWRTPMPPDCPWRPLFMRATPPCEKSRTSRRKTRLSLILPWLGVRRTFNLIPFSSPFARSSGSEPRS